MKIGLIFQEKEVYRLKEVFVAFVCGGPLQDPKTMRSQFLDWLKVEQPEIVTILAENAYNQTYFHSSPPQVNLSKFESLIADIADCLIIFPESVGSFAEVGLFSSNRDLRKKILIVNDNNYYSEDSFINLGPVRTIDSKSILASAIPLILKGEKFDFEPIRERLKRVLHKRQNVRVVLRKFGELNYLLKFILVFELIRIFRLISINGLWSILHQTFGGASKDQLKLLLSILIGAGWIVRRDEYFEAATDTKPLLEYTGVSIQDIQARVVFYHQKNRTRIFQFIDKSVP